jgi:rare lipoprotein A
MRARRTTRVPTAAKLMVGASVLAFPATAMAVTSSSNDSTAAPAAALHAARPAAVRYGQRATVRGNAPISAAGVAIELRYRAANAMSWHVVARGRVRPDGRFALTAAVARSGGLQVVAAGLASDASELTRSAPSFSSKHVSGALTNPVQSTTTTAVAPTTSPSARTTPIEVAASPVRHLTVKPRLLLSGSGKTATAVAGTATQIRGHLLPGIAGRRVVLEVRRGHRWVPTASAHTRRGGGFDFHYVPAATTSQRVHVAFAGDRLNAHADSASRAVTPMQYAQVSWYDDAGNTACGFHATYGIASRTLPCGSKVTISYGGRSVVATVDDRGPFVYSRLYDLNQNVAGALGIYGVATVLASM